MKRRKAREWMLIMGMAACMVTSCSNARSNTPAEDGAGQAENQQNDGGGTAAAGNAGTQTQEGGLSEAEAKKIAYDDAGVSEKDISHSKIHMDTEDGRQIYEIDFVAGNQEYEYDIDASDGAILKKEIKTENGKKHSDENGDLITEAAAVETALRDAGVEEADVSDIRTRLEREDGAQVYEVEFYVGAQEYDYEIDALDGTIRKKDMEIEDDFRTAAPASDTVDSAVDQAEAKKAALGRVPGAGEDTIRIHQDTENGKPVYEGKILYGGMEYEFEIDAATGEFLKWEEEPAHGG